MLRMRPQTMSLAKQHHDFNKKATVVSRYRSAAPQKSKLYLRETKSTFDLFQNLKDPPETTSTASTSLKRKPTRRVIELADKILSLSLIEAADLCELCQEALQSQYGQEVPPGRTPFPHPGGLFAGAMTHGMMPPLTPPMPLPNCGIPSPVSEVSGFPPLPIEKTVTPAESAQTSTPNEEKPKMDKEFVDIKLAEYEPLRKIPVVKEVRAIFGLGIKEAKELVESAPKILKKGVLRQDANNWKDRIEAAGGKVELL